VDDVNTPTDEGRLNLHDESGMTRRDLMKRGAVVGGTLLWVAPAIQTYGSKAFAQENGSPACDACIAVTTGGHTTHVVFDPRRSAASASMRAGARSGQWSRALQVTTASRWVARPSSRVLAQDRS
jgi:hypothetical protein